MIIPHNVACCCLIKYVLENMKDLGEEQYMVLYSKQLIISLRLLQNTTTNLHDFQVLIKDSVPQETLSALSKEMVILNNIERLLDSFAALKELIETRNIQMKRSSILGLFLRKVVLEFKKLSFNDISVLAAFIADYTSSQPVLKQCRDSEITTENMNNSMDIVMEVEKENIQTPKSSPISISLDLNFTRNKKKFISRNHAMRFISEQALLLETKDQLAMTPNKLQLKINEIHCHFPDIHEVYYLSFLNYLRIREINQATVMLQKFFDYKIFTNDKVDIDISVLEKHQLKFKRFRYCALNLGMMHCYFQNYHEALRSLEEAIRISQETNDQHCLNHAMFWLSLVKEEVSTPRDSENHLKQFIAEAAKDILKSDGNNLSQMIDFLGVLRLIKLQTFRGAQKPGKLLSTVSQLVISTPLIANTGQLMRSAMLAFYGFSGLAGILCQTPLQQLKSSARDVDNYSLSNEDLAVGMCQLAYHLHRKGFYDRALDVLSFSKTKFSDYNVHLEKLQFCQAVIQFYQAIAERNISEAFSFVRTIEKLDTDEGKVAACMANLLVGNLTSAMNCLNHLLNDGSSTRLNPQLHAKLALLRIDVYLLSNEPSQSNTFLLEILTLVNSKCMKSVKLDINICLVRYLLHFGLLTKASMVIDDSIVESLSNGSLYQQGMLFFLQAKCLLKNHCKTGSNEQKSVLLQALSLFDRSVECFEKGKYVARLKDVYYEQAIVYHQLQYVQERNQVSTLYRLLHEQVKDLFNVMVF